MTSADARRRFASSPVARLATADATGYPHVVPMVFALDSRIGGDVRAGEQGAAGDTVVGAVDHKPKRTTALRRLANIAANPRVALLADHYAEDWRELWWVRADGVARVVDAHSPAGARAVMLLVDRYPQYAGKPPEGPVLLVDVHRWSGWAASVVR